MKWKEIKPDASEVVTLLVSGVVGIMFACLGLPGHRFRLGSRGPDLSRDAHPVLFWGSEIFAFLLAGLCIILGIRLLRELIRRQRDEERSLEQQAKDSFIREHQQLPGGNINDKDQGN